MGIKKPGQKEVTGLYLNDDLFIALSREAEQEHKPVVSLVREILEKRYKDKIKK